MALYIFLLLKAMVQCWRGYLSGADAIATHYLLL